MKILIIADVYPPEISSAAHLMKELAGGLANRGHDVSVVTTQPRYYLKEGMEKREFPLVKQEGSVKVVRVATLPLHKVNFIIRGVSQLLLPFLFFTKVKKHVKNIDVVIVYSPPLTLGLVGKMVKRRFGAKFILNLQDIFPKNAVDLGVLRNTVLIKFFEWIERKVYRVADVVTFHSEGGRKFLIEHKDVPEKKIVTIPNWIDPHPYQNIEKAIPFREQYGLEGKFIFLFAGIMGPAQGLDFLINVAREVSDMENVVFLLVGGGTEKEKLRKLVNTYKITNVVFKPFVSGDEYPSLVRCANVGVVCLSAENKTPFIPGKFLGYMAAGKPILSFLNKESDGFSLLREANCGRAVVSGELENAVQAVRGMYRERSDLDKLGRNGFLYLSSHFTLDVCLDKLEHLFHK